ncbi:MAG: hypothetical protein HC853_03565 [Anaerolineae bacterium]|nr:hypothetical protein [Anaerolineae bacterium]
MAVTSPALNPKTNSNPPDASKIVASIERVKMSSPLQLAWARFRRNKLGMMGSVIVFLFIFVGLAAPILAPYAYDKGGFKFNQPPGVEPSHPLGTDETGRDFLSRLIYGARTSLFIAGGC